MILYPQYTVSDRRQQGRVSDRRTQNLSVAFDRRVNTTDRRDINTSDRRSSQRSVFDSQLQNNNIGTPILFQGSKNEEIPKDQKDNPFITFLKSIPFLGKLFAPKNSDRPDSVSNTNTNTTSDAVFEKALKITLNFEEGYSNNKYDKGGKTNYGITHFTYDAWRKKNNLPLQDVSKITKEEVEKIYHDEYWVASGADKIAQNNPQMAIALFDTAVNMGAGTAKNMYKQSGGNLKTFLDLREQKYRSIIAKDPSQQIFLNNWLSRTNEIRKICSEPENSNEPTPVSNSNQSDLTSKTGPIIFDPETVKDSSPTGDQISKNGRKVADEIHTKGWCLKGVATALSRMGIELHGASAYEAADQLAKNDKFVEIKVKPEQIKNLPAGAIIVWRKNEKLGNLHGHIAIADGKGGEDSSIHRDGIIDGITSSVYGDKGEDAYRVFVPKDMIK